MKIALRCMSFVLLAILAAVGNQTTLPMSAFADATGQAVIEDSGATIQFPDSIAFNAHITSPDLIERVVLEYGVDQLTCGTVIAKAFPQFKPDTTVDASWVWDMRKSGSEPPGARIWYQWRVIDKVGNETVSTRQTVTWLDTDHQWKSITKGNLTLHWYMGAQSFAQALIDSAYRSLVLLKQQTGVDLQSPIDLYIYASSYDMQKAVLYEPGWTGGLAYPDHDIVIIGISPNQLDWGEQSEAHELTHVLVGHIAFTCLGTIPTWLNEGIAMYVQGGPGQVSMTNLNNAIQSNKLLSIEALSGQFSENQNEADLSYAQSYSIVTYLITNFGHEKIDSLFKDIGKGVAIDVALRDVYGFGLDDLDARWRGVVGAAPSLNGPAVVATLVPTAVPTYPLGGVPAQGTLSPAVNTTPPSGNAGFPLPLAGLILIPVIPVLVGIYFYVKKRKSP